ncbi:hypothetical protein VTJ49DRAFT_5245 [Mycothermus thermophilus]|uniref:Uncharacterized protein n=1 Tax=Humicola insolens TaxID=85995 RepID=A0ABR3V3L1_HUMIN
MSFPSTRHIKAHRQHQLLCWYQQTRTPLEPDFRNEYQDPGDAYRAVFRSLPGASTNHLLDRKAYENVLGRVVLRDDEALTSFFIAAIQAPERMHYVKSLHWHLSFDAVTDPVQLVRDLERVVPLYHQHIALCAASQHLARTLQTCQEPQRSYEVPPVQEESLRHQVFMSLLSHLPWLEHLRITLHGEAPKTLEQLRMGLGQVCPAIGSHRCAGVAPSLTKLSILEADTYRPTHVWGPLVLSPLLAVTKALELEHSPGTWFTRYEDLNTPHHSAAHVCCQDLYAQRTDDPSAELFLRAALPLQEIVIKNFRPLHGVVAAHFLHKCANLAVLQIHGSAASCDAGLDLSNPKSDEEACSRNPTKVPDPDEKGLVVVNVRGNDIDTDDDLIDLECDLNQESEQHHGSVNNNNNNSTPIAEITVNHILSTVPISRRLDYLRIVDDAATPDKIHSAAAALFGSTGSLAPQALGCLTALRFLRVESWMLLGPETQDDRNYTEAAKSLPPSLKRLELVEDRGKNEEGKALVPWAQCSEPPVTRTERLLHSVAEARKRGMYRLLDTVMVWHQSGEESLLWTLERRERLIKRFGKVGGTFWREGTARTEVLFQAYSYS